MSEAFRPGGRIAVGTRQRILDRALQLGYLPNAAARAQRTGRFNAVAFVRGTRLGTDWYPGTLISGVERALEQSGNRLIMARIREERLAEEGYLPHILREHAVDGLLINYIFNIPDSLREMVARHHIPAVWINAPVEHDGVLPDDVHAGRLATEHLLELGHRRVAFAWKPLLPFPENFHQSGPDRRAGYELAMRAAGLEPLLVPPDPRPNPQGDSSQLVEGMRRWLEAHPEVTGVVTYAPLEAEALVQACLRIGKRVPKELSLVTVDIKSSWMTAYILPERQMGEQAVRLLAERMEHPEARAEPVRLRGEMAPGATTQPAA